MVRSKEVRREVKGSIRRVEGSLRMCACVCVSVGYDK